MTKVEKKRDSYKNVRLLCRENGVLTLANILSSRLTDLFRQEKDISKRVLILNIKEIIFDETDKLISKK